MFPALIYLRDTEKSPILVLAIAFSNNIDTELGVKYTDYVENQWICQMPFIHLIVVVVYHAQCMYHNCTLLLTVADTCTQNSKITDNESSRNV